MLTMTMMLVSVCVIMVVGLLQFTATVIRNRPPLEERTLGAESAKSSMRLAIMMQLSNGPTGCIDSANFAPGTFSVNGFATSVQCTPLNYVDTGRDRYGVITTQMDPAIGGLTGDSTGTAAGGSFLKEVVGDVFINGGDLTTKTGDILVAGTSANPAEIEYSSSVDVAPGLIGSATVPLAARYQFGAPPAVECDAAAIGPDGYPMLNSQIVDSGEQLSHYHLPCSTAAPVPWWQRAGDDVNPLDGVEDWLYPRLPSLPTYDRDGKYVDLTATCRMFYPGRYEDALSIDGAGGRQFFFASGIYYFKNPVTITNGARVVFGSGRIAGCANDSDLALHPNSLTNHSITGRGATLLLDGPARLVVRNSSLSINRRISTPTTRGSEGVAIRTVNRGTSTATLEVPRDRVQKDEYPCVETSPDVCATPRLPDFTDDNSIDLTDDIVQFTGSTTKIRYLGSSLAATDDAVELDFTGSTGQGQSQFETDGYVFVPNARISLKTPATGANQRSYRFAMRSGAVASSVQLDARELPNLPAANWFIGVEAQPVQLRVGLVVRVTTGGGMVSISRSIVEVRANGAYAVNSWTVDPNSG